MGILNVWHPDILSFISAKAREGDIANFNLSVMVDEKFMDLVSRKMYDTIWMIHPSSGESITVGQIWSGIVEGIWKNGEPGILFYEEINRHNPLPGLGIIDTTNPCGEQPLLPYESCVLGSINLATCVQKGILNKHDLNKAVRTAVRFLDRIIDKNIYPIPEIEKATKKTRKIGLGLMGVHDALLMVGLPYDSAEGRTWCEEVMQNVTDTAVDESRILAEIFGEFPAWKESIWKEFPLRNAALTSLAPTGTLSLLAQCSSGIEPVYSFVYTRINPLGEKSVIVNPVFCEYLEKAMTEMKLSPEERMKRADDVITHVHENGTIQDLFWLPDEFRSLFKTALDIHWKDHLLMQAALQKHVHASISKTINLPKTATKEDCADAILMAWNLNLKGITLYRTGSRQDVVLSLKDTA
jgi:ribonucleoside-diphosphate reductase alpha chain